MEEGSELKLQSEFKRPELQLVNHQPWSLIFSLIQVLYLNSGYHILLFFNFSPSIFYQRLPLLSFCQIIRTESLLSSLLSVFLCDLVGLISFISISSPMIPSFSISNTGLFTIFRLIYPNTSPFLHVDVLLTDLTQQGPNRNLNLLT